MLLMAAMVMRRDALRPRRPCQRLWPHGAVRSRTASPSFKSGVDLVRIAAVGPRRKGRFVTGPDRTATSKCRQRRVRGRSADSEHDDAPDRARAAVRRQRQHGIDEQVRAGARGRRLPAELAGRRRDEAAIFTFDTQLDDGAAVHDRPRRAATGRSPSFGPVRRDVAARRDRAGEPLDATSARDEAPRAGRADRRRRQASQLTPAEVSRIAQRIDVPVYIFGDRAVDRQPARRDAGTVGQPRARSARSGRSRRAGPAGTCSSRQHAGASSVAARQIVDELRHQYSDRVRIERRSPGWHPLEVRARNKDLVVRARSGYVAGQSRPTVIRRRHSDRLRGRISHA